jgi:hypothetical protein
MQRMTEHNLNAIPVQEGQRSDQIMQTILDNMAAAPAIVSLDTDGFTLPFALHSEEDERSTAMTATQKICQSVLAYAFIKGDTTEGETFTYEREETRDTKTVTAVLDDTMSSLKTSRDTDRIKNKLVGQIHPSRVDAAATTLLAYLENEIPLDGGDTQTIFLRFKDPANLATRISAKDVVTTLAPFTDYTMSATANSGGSDTTADLDVTVSFGGNTAIVELTNTSGARGYVNKLNIFGKGIYLYSPVEIVVESGDGDKRLNYDFFYLADPYRASTFLTHLHGRASDERTDVDNVSFFADADDTLMGYAMNLDIGDRVAILETVTGLVGEYTINKVTYTITQTRTLRVDWSLDSSLLDGPDVLSPY